MGPPRAARAAAGADRGDCDTAVNVPCDAAAPDAAAADSPRLDAARGASSDRLAAAPRVSASSSAASSPRRAPAAAASSPHRSPHRAYAASSGASSAASGDDYSDGSDCDEEEEEAAGANYASAFGGSCADLAAARHGRSAFRVLDDDAIRARQAEAVAAVDAVLRCGAESAMLLLRHFRWAPPARVHEEWFQARSFTALRRASARDDTRIRRACTSTAR
jgi:hypothetical protein